MYNLVPVTEFQETSFIEMPPQRRSLFQRVMERFGIEQMQPLLYCRRHCTKKKAAFALFGLVVMGVVAYVVYWLSSRHTESASVPVTTASPISNATTLFSTTPSASTSTPVTQNASTLASTTLSPTTTPLTTTAGPSTPTPDPRCLKEPVCCDSSGEWICGR